MIKSDKAVFDAFDVYFGCVLQFMQTRKANFGLGDENFLCLLHSKPQMSTSNHLVEAGVVHF